jgi:hypothetical protein
VIVTGESVVKRHADYEQAKQGNVQDATPAAKRLAAELLNEEALSSLKRLPIACAKLVPIHALEGQGFNRIPAAFAELLGEKLEMAVETEVVQVNVVNHTGASGWQRLATPPLFEGRVDAGRRYLLVDDFVGQGGTLANLRGHIMHQGGRVIGAICLTGRDDSRKLALRSQTLDELRKKYGEGLESWWQENCGHNFSCLTESEARYLLRVEDADTVRAKLAEARSQGHG